MKCLSLFKPTVKHFCTNKTVTVRSKPVTIPKVTLHEYLWQNLEKWCDKTAITCFETQRSYTYHQLYKRSLSTTRFLKDSIKLKKQETVGVVLPNVPEYPIVVLGAVQAGLRVTTCNPNYTSDEIRRQLEDSQSRLVFTSRELVPLVSKATEAPIVEVSDDTSVTSGAISFEEISSGQGCQPFSDVTVDDIILLPYSSGTTGLPKGVQLSHYNVVSALCQVNSPEFLIFHPSDGERQDIVPAILPFFHIYGLVANLQYALTNGAKLVTFPRFTPDNFVNLLKNYKPDVLLAIPLIVLMAINHPNIKSEDLVKIRTILSGASPLGASDVERLHRKTHNKISIVQAYGMTETSCIALGQTEHLDHGVKPGGSGLLFPNTRAKIIPSDGSSFQELGSNQSGELLLQGPQIMSGYHNNPQATEEAFTEDNWFKTGDIAHYDDDGHFFITDRLKELIKVKGFQVAPAELEEVLREYPGVIDVGVVGVAHPVLGEAPKAFVVVKPGVKEGQLEEFVASRVAKHKQLAGGVCFIDAIPKSAAGKILRRELKKL